jgi:hypothetical protein
MKTIPLTQGLLTMVDDEDFDILSRVKWCVAWTYRNFYAVRGVLICGKIKRITLHREIMNAPKGMEVDHINHNTLDNRKINLRICTRSENQHNQRKQKKNTSGFKGVFWNKTAKKWHAQIKANGKKKYLGLYDTPEAAARAYDTAARIYYGEFAQYNFITSGE